MERVWALVVGLLAAMAGAWVVVVWAMLVVAKRSDEETERLWRERQEQMESVPRWVWDSDEEPGPRP